MPGWLYRARDGAGRVVRGRLEAPDRQAALAQLRSRGLLVTHLEVDRDVATAVRRQLVAPGRAHRRALGRAELARLCRQLATMLGAGISLVTALRVLQHQNRGTRLGSLLGRVIARLEAGDTFSAALYAQGQAFPEVMSNMVAAGEVGGNLEEVLNRLADHFQREEATIARVKASLTYPAIVLAVATGAVIFLMFFVVPRFLSLFATLEAPLPLPTRVLAAVSFFLQRFWYLVLLVLLAALVAWHLLRGRPRVREAYERFLLRLPLMGELLVDQAWSRTARTLAAMLDAGVPLPMALAVARRAAANLVLRDVLERTEASVQQGRGVSGGLVPGPFVPPMVSQMVAVGEESGSLDRMFLRVAEAFETEAERLTQRMTALAEPAVIILLGLVVGGIMVSIFLPMFSVLRYVG
ncbi:MAG: type II secretion system F family protein [Bacillota bacterium]|nr:type II secretion system F family protein [Bacillota bacterium]